MYQWQVNGSDIDGETEQTLTISNVNASDGGTYTCNITNDIGHDSVSTDLYIFPYFTITPINIILNNGTNLTLQCEAEAFPSPEYKWNRECADEESIRENITIDEMDLSFEPVLFGDEGGYFCEAFNFLGTIRSLSAAVTSKYSVP